MILMKNLYGDPAAGRRRSLQRDEELLGEKFNKIYKAEEINTFKLKTGDMKYEFKSKRLQMDPCVFMLTVTILDVENHTIQEHKMIDSIHTDTRD